MFLSEIRRNFLCSLRPFLSAKGRKPRFFQKILLKSIKRETEGDTYIEQEKLAFTYNALRESFSYQRGVLYER